MKMVDYLIMHKKGANPNDKECSNCETLMPEGQADWCTYRCRLLARKEQMMDYCREYDWQRCPLNRK